MTKFVYIYSDTSYNTIKPIYLSYAAIENTSKNHKIHRVSKLRYTEPIMSCKTLFKTIKKCSLLRCLKCF